MKFLLDNNLSLHFAHALDELVKPSGHRVIALRDKFEASTPDVEWIKVLAEEKNWVLISQDHFRKNSGLEKEAIKKSGLILFSLKKAWVKQPYWNKAHHLVRWFPEIIKQAEIVSGGAAFWIPLNGKKFEQIL